MIWDGTIEVGKYYVARCGLKVRIYATDCGDDRPIHGAILSRDGTEWLHYSWTSDGRFHDDEQLESDCDIVGFWVDPPEPKWRPFREDEMLALLGRIVRRKDNHAKASLVIAVAAEQVFWSGQWGSSVCLFEWFDILQPDGTWGPCGVLEGGS